MFNPLPVPSVSDMDEAIAGLDDGWIGKLSALRFESDRRVPDFAILRHGEVERATAFGRVIVNEQGATILERDGVDAAVGIRQRCGLHRAPGFAMVTRPTISDAALLTAAKDLQHVLRMEKYRRLDSAKLSAVVQRFGFGPRLAQISRALQVNAPTRMLRAGRAEEFAVRQFHWLVFDGAKNSLG